MIRTLLASSTSLLVLAAVPAQNDLRGISFGGNAYAVNSATGTGALLGPTGVAGLNAMARLGDQLVSVSSAGQLVAINPFTGAGTPIVALSPTLTSVRGLATTPAGVLYAIADPGLTSLPDRLHTIDPVTGTTTLVGTTSHNGLQGLASDLAGNLFAWDVGPGTGIGVGLVTVDPVTALSTDVNAGVGNTVDIQCLAVSPAGVLYGGRNALFTLDPSTGVPTQVGSGGFTDLRGMEFVPAASCSLFNGSGVNPSVCSCATAPVLGTSWNIAVTPAPNTLLTLVFVATSALPAPVPLFGGEALIAPPVVDIGSGLGLHAVPLPADASFAGFTLFLQGLRLNSGPAGLQIELTNGQVASLGF